MARRIGLGSGPWEVEGPQLASAFSLPILTLLLAAVIAPLNSGLLAASSESVPPMKAVGSAVPRHALRRAGSGTEGQRSLGGLKTRASIVTNQLEKVLLNDLGNERGKELPDPHT